MTRTTSLRRLAALAVLAALELAIRLLTRLTDRDRTPSSEWTHDERDAW